MEAMGKDRLPESPSAPALPAPWSEVAAGMLFFILLGGTALVIEAPLLRTFRLLNFDPVYLGFVLSLGSYLVILAALLWGWLRDFPRWALPYLAYGFFFAWSLAGTGSYGLVIFNIPIWGVEVERWGWRAWAPLGLVVLLAFLLSRPPWGPLSRLLKKIWNDWTRLVFGLYGLAPLLFLVFLDEMQHSYTFPIVVVAVFFLFSGAFIYLRYPNRRFQFPGLLVSAFLMYLSLGIGSEFYWGTHQVNYPTGKVTLLSGPVPWESILLRSVLISGVVILLMLVPVFLLAFVRRAIKPTEPEAGGPAG